MSRTSTAAFRSGAVIAAIAVAGLALYVCVPRKPDLTRFDPAAMAARETAMWRDYYEKRYVGLFYNLYLSSRDEFGFSPLDSVRIALDAADAARRFQPTTSRREADAALPALIAYYGILAGAAPARFDVEKAARLELDWWQARREAVSAEDYGRTIAATSAMVYGRDDDLIRQAGIERARAMAYRDARGSSITEADWSEIEAQLRGAYEKLRRSVKRQR